MKNKKYPLYMFDVDFDALSPPPEPRDEVVSAPPPPTFTADELVAAREEGLAAGRAEGIAQSNAGFENQIAETLSAMAQSLTTLEEAQRRANEDTARAAVRLAAAAAAKLMPEYARRHGLAEIEAFIAQCLSKLFEGAAVTVRVPEALAAEIGQRIEPIAQRTGFEEGLKLVADPELGPADCRIDWADGGAARNAAKLASEIDDIVEKFLEQRPEPTPPNDPPPPAEDAPAAIEREHEPVMPATAEQKSPAETATAETVAPPPPADLSATETAAETDEAAETPPPIIDVAAEEGATMDVPETPETEAPAVESAIDAAAPETPQAAGPVLPGAIDPAAT